MSVWYYRRMTYGEFVDWLGRVLFCIDVFGIEFWSSYLKVDYNLLYDSFRNFDFRRGFWYIGSRILKVFGRLKEEENTREFLVDMAKKIVRVEGTAVQVLDQFIPTKQMEEFANWLVENSGQVQFDEFSFSQLAKYYGKVSVNTLIRWYKTPGFIKWLNDYCVERLGFMVPILKSSIVHQALKKDATLAEKRFALEVLGELESKKTKDSGGLKVYIFGREVQVSENPKEKEIRVDLDGKTQE
jgi:hypothetical protein